MRFTSTTALVIATLSIAACGGDDGGVNPIDARRIDSTGGPDSTSANCPFPATLSTGAGTGINLTRNDSTMNPGVYRLTTGVLLGMETPPDAMFVQFYNNYAPFGTTAAPGVIDAQTYTIDAIQASFESCGVCLILSSDFDTATGAGVQDYMPSGGTVTINSIDPTVGGTYALTFSNLTFRQVTIDGQSGATTDVPNGCTVTLTDGSLAGSIAAPMAKLAPGQVSRHTKL